VLQPLYVFILWISLKTVGVFQPKNYKVGRSLADNYKSRQNTANPNISRIFGSAGFFLFKNSARKSTMGQTARSLLLYERHQNVADAESAAAALCLSVVYNKARR